MGAQSISKFKPEIQFLFQVVAQMFDQHVRY